MSTQNLKQPLNEVYIFYLFQSHQLNSFIQRFIKILKFYQNLMII